MLIQPLRPTPAVTLLESLEFVSKELGGVRGRADAEDRWILYRSWAEVAVRELRGKISAADLDRMVLTTRYWHIVDARSVDPQILWTELEDRSVDLSAAVESLKAEMARWRDGALVVIDTNVLLHHEQTLDNLDIAAIVGLRDEAIRLLLPMVIIDELDRLKRNDRVRARAGVALAILEKRLGTTAGPATLREEDYTALAEGGIPRGRVSIEVLSDPAGHRRLEIPDDEIVDRSLAVSVFAGRPAHLITFDTGMALRARLAGLAVTKLPAHDRAVGNG